MRAQTLAGTGAEQLDAGYLLHQEQEEDAGIAHDLDQRAVVLEQPERRKGKPADPAKLGLPEHGPVIPQGLPESAVPTAPLFAERFEAFGDFGPGHRMRKK